MNKGNVVNEQNGVSGDTFPNCKGTLEKMSLRGAVEDKGLRAFVRRLPHNRRNKVSCCRNELPNFATLSLI